MLRALSVRDVVLIGRLDLVFAPGLGVLTGETGAGKSILLDSLGLALGARAEARLVRHGAAQAIVTAEFDLPADSPVRSLLAEHGVEAPEEIILLRRTLGTDGRSRAFVNDQAVGVSLLRRIGDLLVEIHGQFESQRLLDPTSHRGLLDAFGGLAPLVAATGEARRAWREAARARARAEADLETARRDEDYLRHVLDEIEKLAPRDGEEAELAERRTLLMNAGRLVETLSQASAELTPGRSVDVLLRNAARHLRKVASQAGGRLDAAIDALERAAMEATEGMALLEKAGAGLDTDPRALDATEERLFALRALARKHGLHPDALPDHARRLATRLGALEEGEFGIVGLRRAEEKARADFVAAADLLGRARVEAAARLDKAMAGEMAPLRLGKARFLTLVEPLPEAEWTESGSDRVIFQAATNPGTPPGPLNRIASGGELSRFTLALKAVLAASDPVPTLIFDEVDSGIGGAVAAAVGERLATLAEHAQVLVVTHSPQVAARGRHHYRVSKQESGGATATGVEALAGEAREEEIARMLAGAHVTLAARAAARSLLGAVLPEPGESSRRSTP